MMPTGGITPPDNMPCDVITCEEAVSTHPAVCTVFFKLLVQLPAETGGLVPPRLCIYAVQNVVLVEAFEKGIACCVALLAV